MAELQKRLNKLRYRRQRKQEYLALLKDKLKETGALVAGGEGEFAKEEARQRFLENEIHKTTLKLTEVREGAVVEPTGGHGEEEVRGDPGDAQQRAAHLLLTGVAGEGRAEGLMV